MVSIKDRDKNRLELYNLSIDLSESNNIQLENPDMTNNLNEKLANWKQEVRKGANIVSQ